MTNVKRIFDVFSKRQASAKLKHDVPQSTRNRVVIWCGELYGNSRMGNYNLEFWQEIHRRLLFRTGSLRLLQSDERVDFTIQAIHHLLNCSGEEFLDFLEDIFSVDRFFNVGRDDTEVIDELNIILRQDNLPYFVTHFVKETVQETSGSRVHDVTYTRTYPKVIMKESEVLHAHAVAPALTLLQRPHFRNANSEYLAALEDYRKGDINDCLTKCGSSFESVMKIICDRKGWKYKQTDPAKDLIKAILPHTRSVSEYSTVNR